MRRGLIVIAVLLLTACHVDTTVDIAMGTDGSGKITVTAVADAGVVAQAPGLADDLRFDDVKTAGWTVTGPTPSSDGGLRVELSHAFANPEEATSVGPQTTTATDIGATTTTAVAPELGLGRSLSMDEAMSQALLPDPTPALLGRPQSIHVVQPPASGQIILVYAPSALLPMSPVTGVGALVSVFPAHIEEGFFAKALGNDATVSSVVVAKADGGYWIEGAPHQLFFDSGGQPQLDTLRLATNTLLWQRGDHIYRLEADVSLETALRIAASVP